MKTFYLTRYFSYFWFNRVKDAINAVANIEIMAIDNLAISSMTQEDHENMSTREDAAFLFKVESVEFKQAAQHLDDVLLSAMDDIEE